jgi:glucan 1,3-beta-glucosidase
MLYACATPWEWSISGAACLVALGTALMLAQALAARLAGADAPPVGRRLRFGWLFALAYYGLLMVFDGRYRDFPLGLFALPAVGYALLALLGRDAMAPSLREERFLAVLLAVLGLAVLVQELGRSPVAWLWLGLNVLLAASVWAACPRRAA